MVMSKRTAIAGRTMVKIWMASGVARVGRVDRGDVGMLRECVIG